MLRFPDIFAYSTSTSSEITALTRAQDFAAPFISFVSSHACSDACITAAACLVLPTTALPNSFRRFSFIFAVVFFQDWGRTVAPVADGCRFNAADGSGALEKIPTCQLVSNPMFFKHPMTLGQGLHSGPAHVVVHLRRSARYRVVEYRVSA